MMSVARWYTALEMGEHFSQLVQNSLKWRLFRLHNSHLAEIDIHAGWAE